MNDQNFKYFQIFENFENPRKFFVKIRELFCFVLRCTQRDNVHN